jgi:hypothetical protein
MNTRERPRIDVIVSKQLLLVADAAVGQEHDLPHGVAVGVMIGERGAHRRDHLGATRRL